MAPRSWFKPKRIGYGATPASWEGWAVTAAYVIAVVVAALTLLNTQGEPRSIGAWVVFGVFTACLTAIFLLFCKAKTEGSWRWRNGHDAN